MVDKFLSKITPRDYQREIFENTKDKNSLIILPTGVGKTLIALMLVIDRMQKFPQEKIVFLAPTKPLADQHFLYFKKHLPELFGEMNLFTGMVKAPTRKELWQRSDIIFSTPQCIANDLKKKLYNLSDVSLLIEDEVHRCVKNYSYTYVAKDYKNQASNPQIIGLTASPGTDKKAIKTICENLNIEHVEIRTRDSKDVKPHLQELEFNIIKIEFPKRFDEIRVLLKKIYDRHVSSLKEKNIIFSPINKITLLKAQTNISDMLRQNPQNYFLYSAASNCASAIKISHALELLETQTLFGLKNYLENIKEQANKNLSKAAKSLAASAEFTNSLNLVNNLLNENLEHPKLIELKSLVEEKINSNPKMKIIIFSQYRESVSTIALELNKIKKIKAKIFVGQTKKGDTGLSQKEQKKIIEDFSIGKFNVLCSTSIGEEGLDIPEVNAVVFYEPIPSAIRKIQRTGRTARLMPGELIMLVTSGTRDETYYWSAIHKEKTMHKAISSIKDDMLTGKLDFQIKQEKLFKNETNT